MTWCVLCVLWSGNVISGQSSAERVVIFVFTWNPVLLAMIFLTIFNTVNFLETKWNCFGTRGHGIGTKGSEKNRVQEKRC